MRNYNYFNKITKDYNDTLHILSGGKFTPLNRKTSGGADEVSKQPKSSFEQWNIEKT